MDRLEVYVSVPWDGDMYENAKEAAEYCKQIAEYGHTPICPLLQIGSFAEHGSKTKRELCDRYIGMSDLIVFCGDSMDNSMLDDLETVDVRYNISLYTFDGFIQLNELLKQQEENIKEDYS